MFRSSCIRKRLFFCVILIALSQSTSQMAGNEISESEKVWQNQKVLVGITSNYQLAVHKKGQNGWTFTQIIELTYQFQDIFLTEELLAVSDKDNWLSVYLDRREDGPFLMTKYEFIERVKLNSKKKLKNVKLEGRDLSFGYEQKIPIFTESNNKQKIKSQNEQEGNLKEAEMKNERLEQKNERILEEVIYTENHPVSFKSEDSPITNMKFVKNNLLYTGDSITAKVLKQENLLFSQVFSSEKQEMGDGIEYDAQRKWFFEGKGVGEISFYQVKEDGSVQEQVIEAVKKQHLVQSIELYEDYLLASFAVEVLLYKWDGAKFNLDTNLEMASFGTKFCSNGNFFVIQNVGQQVQNKVHLYQSVDGNYAKTQSQNTGLSNLAQNIFGSADCSSMIVVPNLPNDAGEYIIKPLMINDQEVQLKYHFLTPTVIEVPAYKGTLCINPEGNIFVTTHDKGAYVWKSYDGGLSWTNSTFIYSYHGVTACAINEKVLVLGSQNGEMTYVDYAEVQLSPQEQFGKKMGFSVSQLQELTEAGRRIIDIKASGNNLAVIEEYFGLRVYKKVQGSYSVNKTLNDWMFLSSIAIDDSLDLMVDGSYSGNITHYLDSGQGFSSVQNIATSSPILCVDFNQKKKQLLTGHMDGSIMTFSWNFQTFTENTYYQSVGTRTYEAKICPDDSIVALKELEGRFYIVTMGKDGDIIQRLRLRELADIKFTISEDCQRVFVAYRMLMRVNLYIKDVDNKFYFSKTIQQRFPVYDVATNSVGDMFVVNIHTNHSSVVYQYDECTDEFLVVKVIEGEGDHYVAEITDQQIILGDLNGKVTVYAYTYLIRETCHNFGAKTISALTNMETVNTVAEASRSITEIEISGKLVIANSLYSGLFFFEIPDEGSIEATPFADSIFISCVSIDASLQTFVAGTFNKSILVYIDSGAGYELNQTIPTNSQVTSLDLTADNKILVGMMNGDMAEFTSDGLSFSESGTNSTNPGGHVYGVKICPNGKLALLETGGVFQLKIYPTGGEVVTFTSELEDELIEPYLDTSLDCSIIAVSGITMQKVQIFKEEIGYSLFATVDIQDPLSKASLEEDGDILVVSSLIKQESYIYQYHICTDKYSLVQALISDVYTESNAMSSKYILQGNEDGTIKVASYSWIYHPLCEEVSSNSSSSARQKSSNYEEINYSNKKMTNTGSEGLEYNPMDEELNTGTVVLIILGSVLFAFLFVFLSTFFRYFSLSISEETKKIIE